MKIAGAQLPIVERIHVKFQKNWPKNVGGEAHTKFIPSTLYIRKKLKVP